jgi:hypothetical protein
MSITVMVVTINIYLLFICGTRVRA